MKVGDEVDTYKGKGKITLITKGNPKLISVGFHTGGYWIFKEEELTIL